MFCLFSFASCGWSALGGTPNPAAERLPSLTRIEAVRNLAHEEARRGYPVQLEGVVTYYDADWGVLFIQDETAGIFVFPGDDPLPVRFGQRVAFTGSSDAGGFAPSIVNPVLRVTGAAPLPLPKRLTYERLLTGQEDGQWVELEGVVRSVNDARELISFGSKHLFMEVATTMGQFRVWVPGVTNQPLPAQLVDAEVRFQGVCGAVHNVSKQLLGIQLLVPSLAQIQVLKPARNDPFDIAARPISSLLRFSRETDNSHRLKVSGIVVHQRPGKDLFIRDETQALQVQSSQTNRVHEGDRVEVLGFVGVGESGPVLRNAVFRQVGIGKPVQAIKVTPTEVLNLEYYENEAAAGKTVRILGDGDLVELEARLLGRSHNTTNHFLVLQSGEIIFNAQVDTVDAGKKLDSIPDGSLVRIAGICLLRLGGPLQRPVGFELVLRSAEELIALKYPSWWTTRRALWILGGLAAVALTALAWVGLLRHRVHQQTRELQGEIEGHKRTEAQLKAEIAERKRMELEVQETHRELLAASHQAGMAEVATSVLHNVGNVLNSLNVSANLIAERVRESKEPSLRRLAQLMRQQGPQLGEYLKQEESGQHIPVFLDRLADHLGQERTGLLAEVDALSRNVDHIKEIVTMQQSYARVVGMVETIPVAEVIEDAVRFQLGALARHEIRIVRALAPLPPVAMDRHKVLQILVNLLSNAKYACAESRSAEKQITVRTAFGREGMIDIEVADNGAGIHPENLTRIFTQGFTTRKNGHGFGLHTSALAAKEMGGSLKVQSDGPGKGASFVLELPCRTGNPKT